MALIEARHLSKVFGPSPKKALALVRGGMSKDELLARTKNVLALDDVSAGLVHHRLHVVAAHHGERGVTR